MEISYWIKWRAQTNLQYTVNTVLTNFRRLSLCYGRFLTTLRQSETANGFGWKFQARSIVRLRLMHAQWSENTVFFDKKHYKGVKIRGPLAS